MDEMLFRAEPSVPQAFVELTLRRRPRPRAMPTFPDVVGVLDPARPGTDRLQAYRALIGARGTDTLPLLYPHVMAGRLHLAMLGRPDFPLSMLGSVHTRTHVRRYAPLPVHGDYVLRAWVDGARPVKSGLEFAVATDLLRDGEVVWSSRNTYLVRGSFGPAEDDPPEAMLSGPDGGRQTAQWPLPSDLGRRYARLCGDYNPIHIASLTAKAFGFKGSIVHGYANLAMALVRVGEPEGAASLDAAFKGPVFLGSRAWASSDEQGRFAVFSPSDRRPAIVGRFEAGAEAPLHASR